MKATATATLALALALAGLPVQAAPAKVIESTHCERAEPLGGITEDRNIEKCTAVFTDGTSRTYWRRDGVNYASYAGAWNLDSRSVF